MRNEMRTVFAATSFAIAGVATAQAADISAMTGYHLDIAKPNYDVSARSLSH